MSVTTVTVRPKSPKSRVPVKYVVAGPYGYRRQEFTNKAEADQYAVTLAHGTRREYVLAG